ncbi:MAG: GNAT family N-acetyltransferase [Hyphomicrobiaceae bacterium]|nr:GNAT family N-acetyltransferase [Hyphomicrobiaceae bacterium]
MHVSLRQARAEDAAHVRALIRAAYGMYVPRMDREPAPMLADYEALVADGVVTVAWVGDMIAGALICYPRDHALHVENVGVNPDFQGHGIGKLLMREAEDQTRAHGLSKIELYTNEVMTENIPFYEALGYVIVNRAEQDGYQRIFFEKEL